MPLSLVRLQVFVGVCSCLLMANLSVTLHCQCNRAFVDYLTSEESKALMKLTLGMKHPHESGASITRFINRWAQLLVLNCDLALGKCDLSTLGCTSWDHVCAHLVGTDQICIVEQARFGPAGLIKGCAFGSLPPTINETCLVLRGVSKSVACSRPMCNTHVSIMPTDVDCVSALDYDFWKSKHSPPLLHGTTLPSVRDADSTNSACALLTWRPAVVGIIILAMFCHYLQHEVIKSIA